MLTLSQTDLIKASAPLLEAYGETLAIHFYRILLDENPAMRPMFNHAHQVERATACAGQCDRGYARHVDRPAALASMDNRIVNKHVSLQVLPEHCPVVGDCLLRAIREVLGVAVATEAVLDAWRVANRQLADVLITAEGAAYEALPPPWAGGEA